VETKGLKEDIRKHVKNCEFLGEFPSVKRNYNTGPPGIKGKTECSFHELIKALLKG